MFKRLSFEDAVRLFKEWGFQVEPGPRPHEVTLILEAADHRSCTVYDAALLPQIATTALEVRWRNGSIAAPIGSRTTRAVGGASRVAMATGARAQTSH